MTVGKGPLSFGVAFPLRSGLVALSTIVAACGGRDRSPVDDPSSPMDAAPDGFAPSLDAADGTRTAYRAWGGNVVDRDNPDPSLPTIDVAPLERLVKLLGCPPR
jgi:hypothetical protein